MVPILAEPFKSSLRCYIEPALKTPVRLIHCLASGRRVAAAVPHSPGSRRPAKETLKQLGRKACPQALSFLRLEAGIDHEVELSAPIEV